MSTQVSSLKVSAEQARHLFDAMGYEVSHLRGSQLILRLASLPDLLQEANKLDDVDDQNLRDEVLEALHNGTPIELAESLVKKEEKEISTAVMEAPEEMPSGEETESTNGYPEQSGEAVTQAPKSKRGRKPKSAQEGTSSPQGGVQKAKGTPRATQPKVLGHSAVSVAHWLGWEKFSLSDAQKALTHYGCNIKDTTLRTYLTDGRRADEKYGKRAVLTLDQASELNSFRTSSSTSKEVKEEVVS